MATRIGIEAAEELVAGRDIQPWSPAESFDPSEHLEFSRPPVTGIIRFDQRSDQQLRDDALEHPEALERERAIWEYADRTGAAALHVLRDAIEREPDPSVRWTTLWAVQKFAGGAALDALAEALHDDHPEVRDWARLLLSEKDGLRAYRTEGRAARFDARNPFDQTLPLQIAGYARVRVPGMGWLQATLSPQWFESIMGRVMACTREERFDTDLIIEKRIKDYHPDGSHHYEIFHFRGFSQELAPGVSHHNYEARACHPFYPSGKVEEYSVAPLPDVIVGAARAANTVRVGFAEAPGRSVVQSVRGRYMGAAYVNVERILMNGMRIGAGEVQLSSHHHPVAGPLTNTLLFGTFKGKLSDLDGDGYLDVNTEPCHGTVRGELDGDLDGIPDRDPFDRRG